MKTVIMAGGRGKRISSLVGDMPKPMIKVSGKPVLEHIIEQLAQQCFTDIIITVGYLGQVIKDYFGDGSKVSPATGKNFGVHIEYYFEKEALGNAGALFLLKEKLTEDFILINADVMFEVDLWRFVNFHREKGGLVTLFTHPNSHPYDSGLIISNENGMVTGWITKEEEHPRYYKNSVNAGLHIVSPLLFEQSVPNGKVDLDRQLLKPLAGTGKMYAYSSSEYIKDMGTPERYKAVCEDYSSGIVRAKSLINRQRAIFLDRDGTINRYVGFLKDLEEFSLLPQTANAIKKINRSGFLVIIVTNQPVIARGEVSVTQLNEIHNKMETLLGMEGAYVDAIYFCPHHPDRGFDGEKLEYKIECECRKPKAGMLYMAAERFNIDLSQSWMVGDGLIDIEAGINAGCRTAFISEENNINKSTVIVRSLIDFVENVLGF